MVFILVTVVTSLLAFSDQSLLTKLIFNPYVIKQRKQFYRFLSSGLIHGDTIHLFFNMFVLWSFGRHVQMEYDLRFGALGGLFYALLYIGGIAMSSVYSYYKHQDNPYYNALGASGGVSSVLFASILFEPWNTLLVFFVIPAPAILVGIGYLIYSARMSKANMDNIGHDAHFYGAIYGVVITIAFKPSIFLDFLKSLSQPHFF